MQNAIIGIYKITNNVSNKCYIGKSVNIKRRWNSHKYELRHNKHNNDDLQSDWNDYGESNFSFEILEECDKEYLNKKEISWIGYYKTNGYVYNMTDGGDGSLNHIVSQETRDKIGKSNTGKIRTKEVCEEISKRNNTNKKKILQFNLDGELIREWNCELEIRKTLSIDTKSIRDCCNKKPKRYTYKNNIWIYKDDYLEDGLDLDYYLKSKQKKAVLQFDLDGNFIKEWECGNDVFKDKVKTNLVMMCCRGERKSAYGFKFKFKR